MGQWKPAPGFGWNPLRRLRNLPCPCGSTKKAKKCHGAFDYLPLEDIKKVNAWIGTLIQNGFLDEKGSS